MGETVNQIEKLKEDLKKEQNKEQPDEEKIRRLTQKIMISAMGLTGSEVNGNGMMGR